MKKGKMTFMSFGLLLLVTSCGVSSTINTIDPELLKERDKYGANNIKPGLTGLAQINGRDKISDIEKAKFDGEYVKNRNFWYDMVLVFKTIRYVLRREDIVDE